MIVDEIMLVGECARIWNRARRESRSKTKSRDVTSTILTFAPKQEREDAHKMRVRVKKKAIPRGCE